MNIENHINLLLKKYNLQALYNKYTYTSTFFTLIRESFQWCLLYFSSIVKKYTHLMFHFVMILLILLLITVPLEKYFNTIKNTLINELKIANYKYFNERIMQLNKNELLNFDLITFYNTIDKLNINLDQYITNLKIKFDIPLRFVSLIIIAITKDFYLLILLFIIFYIIVKLLNESKLLKENVLTNEFFYYDNIIRSYIINSKNFLINDELNSKYLLGNITKFENVQTNIQELNNTLDFKINTWMLVYIFIVMKMKLKTLNAFDFYYYFITIYDTEYISDKILLYYRNKYIINRMQKRLDYLYQFNPLNSSNENSYEDIKVINIIINEFYNNKPLLINKNKIIINECDHVLLTGKSGSGKTSFLYLLKGVIKINDLNI